MIYISKGSRPLLCGTNEHRGIPYGPLEKLFTVPSCSKADDEPKFRNQEGRHGKTDWDRAMITHSAQTTEGFIPTEMNASLINMINLK